MSEAVGGMGVQEMGQRIHVALATNEGLAVEGARCVDVRVSLLLV
jgi:hypothetical protein